ncbi:MAG: hypothetical protein H7Y89_00220 [Steroidobacteraceae bacterium]|nr:hypothetical protein [Steroidobacteraceae bacterium]
MRVVSLFALLAASGAVQAASFDCSKAATATEKLICANARISDLDEHLGRYYSAARGELGRGGACLASTQREWLRKVRNACKDSACLERAYLQRLAELDPLQPGMTALKNEDLPNVKSLVWIIPPELDTVAAPKPKRNDPLIVVGKLIDDVADGDGFVIQDAKSKKFVLLSTMFIDEQNGIGLKSLAHGGSFRYEARGVRETSDDGSTHFAAGACTYVFRLPQ